MTQENNNKKITYYLFNHFPLFASIIAIIWGLFIFLTQPRHDLEMQITLVQNDIQIIKNNHFEHIKRIEENIQTLCEDAKKRDQIIQENQKTIIQILTTLKMEEL